MAERRHVAVDVAAGRGGGPDGAGREVVGGGGGGRGEVVVEGVGGQRRHAAREVRPGGVEGEAGGEGDGDGGVGVPFYARGGLPVEFEDELEECEAEVAAGGVAGEDDLRAGDCGVRRAGGWGEEGEVCD